MSFRGSFSFCVTQLVGLQNLSACKRAIKTNQVEHATQCLACSILISTYVFAGFGKQATNRATLPAQPLLSNVVSAIFTALFVICKQYHNSGSLVYFKCPFRYYLHTSKTRSSKTNTNQKWLLTNIGLYPSLSQPMNYVFSAHFSFKVHAREICE